MERILCSIMILIFAVGSLAPLSSVQAQDPQKTQIQADEKIDLAMGVFTDYDLLRLRARVPVKRGAPIKPPFKQEPPDAQTDFCPKCP